MASSPVEPSRPVYGPPAAAPTSHPAGRSASAGGSGSSAAVLPGRAAPRLEPADGQAPTVVVVGAAARVLDPADPRGWQLGGEAAHGALLLARLGLRVGAVLGVDAATAGAPELELLRDAGAEVHLVGLAAGPILEPPGSASHDPVARSARRRRAGPRRCAEAGSPLPVTALPSTWRAAPAWHLAPAADELAGGWAAIPPGAVVALAWQGALRTGADGAPLRPGPPASRAMVRRADLVGLAADEIAGEDDLRARLAQLRPGSLCVLTLGTRGGIAITARPTAPRMRRWSVPVGPRPTGAAAPDAAGGASGASSAGAGRPGVPDDGIFLAALLAARVAPAVAGRQPHLPAALAFAATVAAARRGPGLANVPTLAEVHAELRAPRRDDAPPGTADRYDGGAPAGSGAGP